MEEPSKFAIHEAARDGRSKKETENQPATATDMLTNFPATVVESLLNVRFIQRYGSYS
jgi:hypothetical protein